MPIQALFCDLDETLAADSESTRLSLDRVIPDILSRYPGLLYEKIFTTFKQLNNRHWEHFEESPLKHLLDPLEVRTLIWNEVFDAMNIHDPPLASRIAERFQRARMETYRCYEDTIPVLNALHGKIRIILVTNGNSRMQRDKIEVCGLQPYLDEIFIAQEVGLSKPDRRIFDLALEAANAAPETVLMVGDHPVKDILGANEAGCRTAWMRRNPVKPSTLDPQPDYRVYSMEDVFKIIERSCPEPNGLGLLLTASEKTA